MTAAPNRKRLVAIVAIVGAVGLLLAALPFVGSMNPSERVLAGADSWRPVKVNISELNAGEIKRVKWQEMPVLILKRDGRDLARLPELNESLYDPLSEIDSDPPYIDKIQRSIRPEYFVFINRSTYCGCALVYAEKWGDAELPGGVFYDPCHIGTYDISGRLLKNSVMQPSGDACNDRMTNLVIPPHRFISEEEIIIGEEPNA